jgi:hypothetical protein
MTQLKKVLKSNENWNELSVEEGILNVLSYVVRKREVLKSIELRLLVPYYTEKLKLVGEQMDPQHLKQLTINYNQFTEKVNEESPEIIMTFVKLFRKAIEESPELKEKIKPNMLNVFSINECKIYTNDITKSLTDLRISINKEIESKFSTKVHVVYLIDSELCKSINFSDVNFVNYIVF